ncbi:12118_t:CDS:1 [Racocetra fulgida]|uniref:12118_t:CDS:1 n=1 Tax=Racocetra fulgida TaxID=60492 RepID=A0A9N9IA45_9GLOM|nr:12118_t:CDS:1 [Racocetra fulgida]
MLILLIKIAFTQPIINNDEDAIDYWTEERMANAQPIIPPTSNSNEITSNVTIINDISDSGSESLFAIPIAVGKLFFVHSGEHYTCTASVIDTRDGNTGITASHCLYSDGEYSTKVIFSPGYSNGKPRSDLGKIRVTGLSVPKSYIEFDEDDYAMIQFNYPGKLKDQTGAFGWGLTPASPIKVTTFGYPGNGDLNCPRDGKTCCYWVGDATIKNVLGLPDLAAWNVPMNLGKGGSGGPWVMRVGALNPFGYLVGVTGYVVGNDGSFADILNFTLIEELIDWPSS